MVIVCTKTLVEHSRVAMLDQTSSASPIHSSRDIEISTSMTREQQSAYYASWLGMITPFGWDYVFDQFQLLTLVRNEHDPARYGVQSERYLVRGTLNTSVRACLQVPVALADPPSPSLTTSPSTIFYVTPSAGSLFVCLR